MGWRTWWSAKGKVQQAGEGRSKSTFPIRTVVAVVRRVADGLGGVSCVAVVYPEGFVAVARAPPTGVADVVDIEKPSLD